MYFGTAADLPAELTAARSKARTATANRAMSCDQSRAAYGDIPRWRTTANYFFTMTMALGPLPDGTVGWAMGVSVPFAPMVY